MVALLVAGVLAVAAAGTVVGIDLAGSKPAGNHGPGGSSASAAARRSQALTATGSGSSTPAGQAPAAPRDVAATAVNRHTIQVTWADSATDITGFNVTNGCGTDGCSGGAINVRTGRVTTAEITTTPGAYQCFYVQALNNAGTSTSRVPGCISTPGINIPSNQEWSDTGVTVIAGPPSASARSVMPTWRRPAHYRPRPETRPAIRRRTTPHTARSSRPRNCRAGR